MIFSNYIGWDIGGAHLKVAEVDAAGEVKHVAQYATPIWHGLDKLEDGFFQATNRLPGGVLSHAVTMTAELVDMFADRQSGMIQLINLCEKSLGKNIVMYAPNKGFINIDEARTQLNLIASANWHATASYIANVIETGLFIDIGSTTTDIIPFRNSALSNRGKNDQSRLKFDELVYTGVIRTPVMSLTQKVPFAGEWQSLAAEHFANTADIYRILNYLDEEDDLMQTADGNVKDKTASVKRLARMLGADAILPAEEALWIQLARYLAECQLQTITNAVLRVLSHHPDKNIKVIGAGVGIFLVKKIAQRLDFPYVEFSELTQSEVQLHYKINVCAPAIALAQLNRISVLA